MNYILLCTPIRHDPLTREIHETVLDYLQVSKHLCFRANNRRKSIACHGIASFNILRDFSQSPDLNGKCILFWEVHRNYFYNHEIRFIDLRIENLYFNFQVGNFVNFQCIFKHHNMHFQIKPNCNKIKNISSRNVVLTIHRLSIVYYFDSTLPNLFI